MAVIELGVLNHGDDEPAPGSGRRPLRRPELRRVLVALVAAGCVLTVTGSARPDPGGLPELWSTPLRQDVDTFRLTDDSAYVLSTGRVPRLTAYDARTGAVRWSSTGVEERSALAAVGDGVILLPAGFTTVKHQDPDGAVSTQEISRDTVALDAATGRQLWRQRGEVTATLGDRALLSEWNETGDGARLLRVVRVPDGSTVWSHASGEADFWTTDSSLTAAVDRLVTVTPKGRAEVVSLADGAVVATGQLPWISQSQNDDYTTITVQGHQLFLDQMRQNNSTVSAYDTETLRPLWTVTQASPGGSYGCGPVICLTETSGVAGHDRATGRQLWRLAGAVNVFPQLGSRLIIEEDSGTRRSLLDGATGRRLADLGEATPVWDAAGRTTQYLVARTTQPADRTSVGSFGPADTKVRLRGTIAPISDYGCQNAGRLLACQTRDNRLIVTDVG